MISQTPPSGKRAATRKRPASDGASRVVSRNGRANPAAPDPETAARTALWEAPAFQEALEEARASLAEEGGLTGEELDERLGIADEDRAAAEAWLDEYERRLEAAAKPNGRVVPGR